MPEGHALHRLASDLTTVFVGHVVASTSPQGRFTAGASRVDGRVVADAEVWGKHLLISVNGLAERVHVHLGLYGAWTIRPGDSHPVVGQVRWRLSHGSATADLRGPTVCEFLDPGAVDALIARLGPDPLRSDADPDRAWQRVHSSRAPLATLLMDQRVLAGVGNIYRAELLFRHGLDPDLPGHQLDPDIWAALWADLVGLMSTGERSGRIDTVRPEHEPEAMGRAPRVDDHGGEVYVYRRADQPCLVCGMPVRRRALAGRNLYWCPSCQHRR